MSLLILDPLLSIDWLYQAKQAETAPPGGAPGPMASVVPGQVSSAPVGPVSPPAPVPGTNPLTGATAQNPGVTSQVSHRPATVKKGEMEMYEPQETFLPLQPRRSVGYLEGLKHYTANKILENHDVSRRPNDPLKTVSESTLN